MPRYTFEKAPSRLLASPTKLQSREAVRISIAAVVTRHLDLILMAAVVGAFIVIASQRLGKVPVPDIADEPFMLQTPYEVLHEGKFGQGMYRFLGGNIENAWRSLEPGCLLLLTGFFRIFGFGLLQARAFNLAAAAAILAILFFIGRKLVNWRAGLIAVVLLASDPTFLQRGRMVRTDFAPEMFGLLAFYLYEFGEDRKSWRFYVGAGLSAGAAVLCHPNMLYLAGAILLMIVLRHGFRGLTSKYSFQFVGSFVAVLAYTIITSLMDYKNLRMQYRDDPVHFGMLTGWTWWHNILAEADRYTAWWSGAGLTFSNLPLALLHFFQALAALALLYLGGRMLARHSAARIIDDPRTRIVLVTLAAVVFFAFVSRKTIYYVVHIETWLALCAGVMLADGIDALRHLRFHHSRFSRTGYAMVISLAALAILVYGFLLVRQNRRYLGAVRNPELASFEEFTEVIRSVVPPGVCPVAVKAPVIWVAFPESDRCFATIEKRMLGSVDLAGKDYALVTQDKGPENWSRALIGNYHLLGQLGATPYGDLSIYYTGANPEYLKAPPARYQFFGRWRGHASDAMISKAADVWSAGAVDLARTTGSAFATTPRGLAIRPARTGKGGDGFVDLSDLELKPQTIYQLEMDATLLSPGWEIVLADTRSGEWLIQIPGDESESPQKLKGVFRTFETARVRVLARNTVNTSSSPLYLSNMIIREIGPLAPNTQSPGPSM